MSIKTLVGAFAALTLMATAATAQPKPAAKDAKPAAAAAKSAPAAVAQAKAEPVDINSATADQLKAVAGIGDAYSAKIIKGRPYKSKDELWRKKIMSKGAYEKLKEHIIAKQ